MWIGGLTLHDVKEITLGKSEHEINKYGIPQKFFVYTLKIKSVYEDKYCHFEIDLHSKEPNLKIKKEKK